MDRVRVYGQSVEERELFIHTRSGGAQHVHLIDLYR